MNFERQYLAALDALIVALGGVVPVAATPNFQVAHLLRLVAIVQAVGGVLPSPSINYHAAVLAHWRAAIAARGGVVPVAFVNFSQAVLLHVQAFQTTRGISVALSAPNFEQNMLALLSAVPSGYVYDTDAAAYLTAVEAADGQALETSTKQAIDAFFVGTKLDGDFAKLKAACILGGARTLAGALVPLVATMPSPTNVGFVAGDRSRAGGLKGKTNAYLNLNRQSDADPLNDYHQIVWVAGDMPATIGNASITITSGYGVSASANQLLVSLASAQVRSRSITSTPISNTSASGFFGHSRNNSATFDSLLPQDALVSSSVASVAGTSRRTFLFGRNGSDAGDGNPTIYGTSRALFYSAGESLNLVNLRSRLNTLAAALATL